MSSTEYLTYQQKVAELRQVASQYRRDTLIETGLYNGHGSGMQLLDLFRTYHVIDATAANITLAKANCPTARVWYGDSRHLIEPVIAVVGEPAFFWLDAHYWDGDEWPDDLERASPLLAEIAAIRAWPHAARSVILIDDIRQMRGGREEQRGWPSEQEVRAALGDDLWTVEGRDDILRCIPR